MKFLKVFLIDPIKDTKLTEKWADLVGEEKEKNEFRGGQGVCFFQVCNT